MDITHLSCEPVHVIPYVNAARGGGVERAILPVLAGTAMLPGALDALVVTSDLQGVVFDPGMGGESALLGISVADDVRELMGALDLGRPERTGVLLAGDFYAAPEGDERGASGDVREVWTAFAARFRWVAGVSGNHDRFGTERDQRRFGSSPRIHLLDGAARTLDGLRVGGVSGIMGNPRKPMRREPLVFLDQIEHVVETGLDVLVLHEGPDGDRKQRGSAFVRDALETCDVPLTVCGHSHWPHPIAELGPGRRVLNVDARVVILTKG